LKSDTLKDRYISIIGTDNVDLLDEIKQLPMHKFGIYFDFKQDNDERLAFEQSLINPVNTKEINSAQYNITRQIRNVKSAIKFLEYSIGENRKRLQEEKLQSIQAQGDVNLQNQSLIEREKQKTKAQEVDAKIMILR